MVSILKYQSLNSEFSRKTSEARTRDIFASSLAFYTCCCTNLVQQLLNFLGTILLQKGLSSIKLGANGRNNSQNRWPANLGVVASVCWQWCAKADATTPNNVGLSLVLVYHAKLLCCCLQGDHE